MKRNQLLKHLRKNGCVLIREGGSHSWWGNPGRNLRSSVPRHSEVIDQLARKICKDLGVAEKPNLQRSGNNAKVYQVRQVRDIILRYRLGEEL